MGGGKEDQKQETPATEGLSMDSNEQSLPQEIQSLLEKQTEKIQCLENQLADLERERQESEEIHQQEILGMRDQIREAEARADQVIGNVERAREGDRKKHEDEIARIAKEMESARQRAYGLRNQLRAVGWYSILVTLLAIVFSRSFQWACSEFWSVIQRNVVPTVCLILGTPARIAHLADGIPHEVWASVVYWAALLWSCGAEIEIIYGCGWLIRRGGRFYRDRLADPTSLAVALISLAAAIFFAGPLRAVGINAILLILIVNAGYTIWRSVRIVRTDRN